MHMLTDSLSKLAQFAHERGNDGNERRVRQLLSRLETQTFNLVVFGEFKRGKTTFINALLGLDLLPAAVVPLTSVVTILHHGSSLRTEVEFSDGRTEEIDPERLADYVTERGNPENTRGVKLARVAVPCALLENGMQLVDTPGVGSVYDHNTEAARDFLPQVDGAILIVAADPPISRGECEFLMEMRPHVARLFVVQNKIDLLSPSEAAESLAFTEQTLCEILSDEEIEVFALSAREALEAQLEYDEQRFTDSGMPRFIEELERFQQEEQQETLVLSLVRAALEVAEDEALGLDLERQAMRMSVEEIERRLAEFHRRRADLLEQREDDITLIRAAARKLIAKTLERDYRQERDTRVPELRQRFEHWAEQQEGVPINRLVKEGNEFIRETLFEVLNEWRRNEERRLEDELGDILERFTKRANEVLSAIYDLAREIFELPPRSVETIGYLAAPSRFHWQDWRWKVRPGVSGSFLGRWLPGARNRTLRAIEQTLLDEHNKACGRLRHDFAERTRVAFDDYVASVRRSLTEAIEGIDRVIERAIEQKRRTVEQAEDTAQRLDAQRDHLQSLISALEAALPEGERGAQTPAAD